MLICCRMEHDFRSLLGKEPRKLPHIGNITNRYMQTRGIAIRVYPFVGMYRVLKSGGRQPIGLSIERMQVQRYKMHTRADIGLCKCLNKSIACNCQALRMQTQDVEMPGMFDVLRVRWNLKFRPL